MRRWLGVMGLLAGCASVEPAAPAPVVMPGARPGVTLPYRVVDLQHDTDVARHGKWRSAAVRSEAELNAYLTGVAGDAAARLARPYMLDFARETGLFLTPGVAPDLGTKVEATRLTEAGGRLEVRFSAYDSGAPRQGLAQPVLYLAIPRTELPVDIQQDLPCVQLPDAPARSCR